METFPEQNYPEKYDKPDRIITELKSGRKTSINGAKIDKFIACPNRHTPSNGPKHIIQDLISKSESAIIAHHISAIEFQPVTLPAHYPEPQMQSACYNKD
tara:strand:+ start:227 stop:526 length:300 start_codon:yes stop_codon:yes gene_type:complete